MTWQPRKDAAAQRESCGSPRLGKASSSSSSSSIVGPSTWTPMLGWVKEGIMAGAAECPSRAGRGWPRSPLAWRNPKCQRGVVWRLKAPGSQSRDRVLPQDAQSRALASPSKTLAPFPGEQHECLHGAAERSLAAPRLQRLPRHHKQTVSTGSRGSTLCPPRAMRPLGPRTHSLGEDGSRRASGGYPGRIWGRISVV